MERVEIWGPMMTDSQQFEVKRSILHVSRREILRPIRDEILRQSGYDVKSTCEREEALEMFRAHPFSLVLVDVEGVEGISLAEGLCGDVRTIHRGQLVAFVCNWRVAIMTDCPDEILRTEFDPAAFVAGVKELLATAPKAETQSRP